MISLLVLLHEAHDQGQDQPGGGDPLGGRSDHALAILTGLVHVGVGVAGQSAQALILAVLQQDNGDQCDAQDTNKDVKSANNRVKRVVVDELPEL